MHLFFSTPIWTSKIEKYQTVNNNMQNYISNLQASRRTPREQMPNHCEIMPQSRF